MTAVTKPSRRTQRERNILRATLEELAGADYGALSMDDVAKRAGVNKTTVYRKWPTKADLVGSALLAFAEQISLAPSTGSLRGDLLHIGRQMLNLALSLEGQGLARLSLLRRPERELAVTMVRLREQRNAKLEDLLGSAVERGELARDADLPLMLDMLGGLLHVRLFVKGTGVDELLITRAVDVLLHGVSAPAPQRPKKRPAKKRNR